MSDTQSIDPTTKLDVTLQANEWNKVMEIIANTKGFSYVETAPLLGKIGQQIQTAAQVISHPAMKVRDEAAD